nr:MAG TPA: hypothetical protein [Crassvirales sp.]
MNCWKLSCNQQPRLNNYKILDKLFSKVQRLS